MEKKIMGSSLWVFCLAMLLLSANSVHAISCSDAITSLLPCLPFLVGSGSSTPSTPCCLGVQSVNAQATTAQDRRLLCNCFVNASKSFGVNAEHAKQLPQLCHVQTPVPIDPNINCSSISYSTIVL